MKHRSRTISYRIALAVTAALVAAPVAGHAASAVPTAPTGLTAGTTSPVTLTWTDGASDESGFSIERCTGGGCTDFAVVGSTAPNVTSFPDAFVAPGTTNRFRVRAWNDRGYSAYSNVAESFRFAATVLPNAVATATTTAGTAPTTITFDGSASTPMNGVIQAWDWSFGDGTTATGAVVTHTFTQWATFGVTLRIRDLWATDTMTIPVTISAPPLAAATDLRSTSSVRRTAALTWTNPVGDATSITVQRCSGARCTNFAAVANFGGSAVSFTDTGLRSGTTYRYRLLVANAAGTTALSNITTVKAR